MFETLSEKFESVFKKLRGEARLTEENIREAMREVRVALLEADVNFKVVKDFTRGVTEKAVGTETLKSVRPSQQIVKIVYEELVAMMGGAVAPLRLKPGETQVMLLLGLQGSGKTTFAGKLAFFAQKHGLRPILIACDVYRPAAIRQLRVVGEAVGVPVFDLGTETPVPEIALKGLEEGRRQGRELAIVDTAGRLHIDEVRMDELVELKAAVRPAYTLLVADAMTGQDAVNSATAFNDGVGIDGVCLTKIDGDARGGAALSIRAVTGKPIYFVGTGERPADLEPFHPDRLASRILGMGDVVTLVERAQEAIDARQAEELQRKLKREEFTLQDFLDQMQRMKKMGPLGSLVKMIPGIGSLAKDLDVDEEAFTPTEAIINSMTPEEREQPDLLNGSRRQRIARGSGTTPADVNALLDEFRTMRKLMSQMMKGSLKPGGAGGLRKGAVNHRAALSAAELSRMKPKHRRKRKTKKTQKGRSR